ncbi:MAG: nucleotide exchange factor GrpE [Candidatus Promineifilaceae bacterium]|nr:nucleotide exchange factor GrpE [Candidatus Promineifilaceae bacterium]
MADQTDMAEQQEEADPLMTARAEAAEWQDRYLRLAAETENVRKRIERTHAERASQSQERLLRDLLPLVDNLERALAHTAPTEQQTSLYSGLELAVRDFLRALNRHGVERIDALGQPFDPALHEAVGVAPHPTLAPNTVMHVELPGYVYNGRLLRPARVLVVAG